MSATREWLIAAQNLGATQVGVKVIEPGGKWRRALPLNDPQDRLVAARLLESLYADPSTEVEAWCFHVRASDGETVYVEPLAHQWQVRFPEAGADPVPETYVIGEGGDRVEVTL